MDKKQVVKTIRKDVETFAEALKSENWNNAFEVGMSLNQFLKTEEVQALAEADLKDIDIKTLKSELAKYFYINGEFRKCRGALIKKGDKLLATVGS